MSKSNQLARESWTELDEERFQANQELDNDPEYLIWSESLDEQNLEEIERTIPF